MNKKYPDTNSNALLKRVENLIGAHHLITKNDTLIVAVSGGPDSIALLHLLYRIDLPSKLVAVYVNHGLRPEETGAEIGLIERLCHGMHVPFETVDIDVHGEQQRTGSSIEEAARILRYDALEKTRINHGASAIAVAHTADDQAEEILLRLIRGSSRKGLSGMNLRRGSIIRPLLQEKKQTLVDFLKENTIPFCLDSSNWNRAFLRNRVRIDLLPYLERNFNSSIRRNLLQTAEILNAEEELLTQLTEESCRHLLEILENQESHAEPCPERIKIKTRLFLDCHQALQRRIIEKACWMMMTRPGFRQIELIRTLIGEGLNGAETHLGAGLRVWKTSDEIIFTHPAGRRGFRGSGLENAPAETMVNGPGIFPCATHVLSIRLRTERPGEMRDSELLLDAEKITFPLLLRSPLPGERFRPLGATGRKKINRFLADAKIPRQDRRFFPVLLSEDTIIAVVGLRIDHDCRVREDTLRFLLIDWRRL